MMQSVFAWVVETYAGHTLAEVEPLIERGIKMIDYGRVWNSLLDQKKDIARLVAARRPFAFDTSVLGDAQSIQANPLDAGWEVAVVGYKPQTEQLQSDEEAIEWLTSRINSQLRDLHLAAQLSSSSRGRKKRPNYDVKWNVDRFKSNWVELIRIRRMLQPYAKKVKARSWARQKFPLDLTGWKYLRQVDSEQFRANLIRSNFDQIQVTLTFTPKKNWEGLWQDQTYTLTLVAPGFPGIDAKAIQEALAGLKDILEHEMIHVGQTILQRGKGLKEEGGLPGRSLREEGVSPSGLRLRQPGDRRTPHELQDVEFYTRLNDTVRDFEKRVQKVPVGKREDFFNDYVKRNTWFRVLRQKAPRKYAKAVSELRKAIESLLPV